MSKAQKEREERFLKRKKETAAEKIQSIWKGRQTRIRVSEQILNEWVKSFGDFVADPEKKLSAERLYRIKTPSRFRPMSLLLGDVLPGVCFAVLPLLSTVRRNLYRHGLALTRLQLSHRIAVRGALALLIRSINASEPSMRYTSLSTHPVLKARSKKSKDLTKGFRRKRG